MIKRIKCKNGIELLEQRSFYVRDVDDNIDLLCTSSLATANNFYDTIQAGITEQKRKEKEDARTAREAKKRK